MLKYSKIHSAATWTTRLASRTDDPVGAQQVVVVVGRSGVEHAVGGPRNRAPSTVHGASRRKNYGSATTAEQIAVA